MKAQTELGLISMAIAALGFGLLAAFAGGSWLVGHQWDGPYVYRPRYFPSFNPCYCQPYSYPMMCMGPGMGTGAAFYPWLQPSASPMPWFQPSAFGYW